MHEASHPDNEAARLHRLRTLDLLDTAEEELIDGFTRLAAGMTGQPIALLSLIDADRQWVKSECGLPGGVDLPREIPRAVSLCAHAICQPGQVFEVEDARVDPRFRASPVVVGEPWVVHYAGAPLVMPGGEAIGTLCVTGSKPGLLTELQRQTLLQLADQVVRVLLLREQERSLLQEKLLTDAIDLSDIAPAGLYALDADGGVVQANRQWVAMLGARDLGSVLGERWMERVHPDDLSHLVAMRNEAIAARRPYSHLVRTLPDATGNSRFLRVRVAPVADNMAPICFVGTAVDITEHRAEYARLEQQNQFLTDVIEHLPFGVVAVDKQNGPAISNAVARSILADDERTIEATGPGLWLLEHYLAGAVTRAQINIAAPRQSSGGAMKARSQHMPEGGIITVLLDE